MGVYLCIGQQIHETPYEKAILYDTLNSFDAIHNHIEKEGKILVFLSDGYHRLSGVLQIEVAPSSAESLHLLVV